MNVRISEGWGRMLREEFDKDYFTSLTDFVRTEYKTYRVYPPAAKIFSAFDTCPFENTKVVIIGQDPYHGYGQAHGLCFSVNDGVPFPPSLRNIFIEIQNETGKPIPPSGCLDRWARQGVLLLNATLTVREASPGSHQGKGWERFTDSVIETVSREKNNVVFMLWGAYARSKARLIDPTRHLILEANHPKPIKRQPRRVVRMRTFHEGQPVPPVQGLAYDRMVKTPRANMPGKACKKSISVKET